MEQAIVSGIAHDASEAKVTVHGVPDRPGVAARLFGTMADENVNIDMIVQNVSSEGHTDISFTVGRENASTALAAAKRLVPEFEAAGADVDNNIAKVSVVGAGMRSNPGIAARMFGVLGEAGINIEMISTSAIRISCVIRGDQVDAAVNALHDAFEPPMQPQEETEG